jgi:hypothetical protein
VAFFERGDDFCATCFEVVRRLAGGYLEDFCVWREPRDLGGVCRARGRGVRRWVVRDVLFWTSSVCK